MFTSVERLTSTVMYRKCPLITDSNLGHGHLAFITHILYFRSGIDSFKFLSRIYHLLATTLYQKTEALIKTHCLALWCFLILD